MAAFKLELVAHCWQYDRLLCHQLSALLLHPPPLDSMEVVATIFYCRDDLPTVAVLDWFAAHSWPANVRLNPWPLSRQHLCRRAIGRDLACKASAATWLWLADVDYLPLAGCLDGMASQLQQVAGPLAFPRLTMRSTSHAAGDKYIEQVTSPGVYEVDPADFSRETNRRAIGGIQLYRGDVARERGYLGDRPKWHRPAKVWRRTFEDKAMRGWLHAGNGRPIDVPNLYRIRHSKRGRRDINCRL